MSKHSAHLTTDSLRIESSAAPAAHAACVEPGAAAAAVPVNEWPLASAASHAAGAARVHDAGRAALALLYCPADGADTLRAVVALVAVVADAS